MAQGGCRGPKPLPFTTNSSRVVSCTTGMRPPAAQCAALHLADFDCALPPASVTQHSRRDEQQTASQVPATNAAPHKATNLKQVMRAAACSRHLLTPWSAVDKTCSASSCCASRRPAHSSWHVVHHPAVHPAPQPVHKLPCSASSCSLELACSHCMPDDLSPRARLETVS